MISPNEKIAELETLLWRLRDDSIDDNGLARLETLVTNDPEARRYYVRYGVLCGGLRWINSGTPSADGESGGLVEELPCLSIFPLTTTQNPLPASFVGGPVFSYMVAAVVLCVMLFGAWAYKISVCKDNYIVEPSPILGQSHSQYVARITGMTDCVWAEHEPFTIRGAIVRLGRKFALSSGLLEITYNDGARVILEGPCEYTVDSRTGGYLQIGNLVARVEKNDELGIRNDELTRQDSDIHHSSFINHHLFSVTTPTTIVTDLGTEFGVAVSDNGDTISHVFQGSVEVRTAPRGNKPSKQIVLGTNQSVRISGNNDEIDLSLVADDFATNDVGSNASQSKNEMIAARFIRRMPLSNRRKPIFSRSNPVVRGAVRIDGRFDDWKNITCYPDDPSDDATYDTRTSVDLVRGAVAHDEDNFYFLYEQANPVGILRYVPWVFLDTDLNLRTGRKQSRLEYPLRFVQSGNLRSGMDVKLEGGVRDTFPLPLGAEFNISGGSNLFVWDPLGLSKVQILDFGTEGLEYAVSDDKKRVEICIPRQLLGNTDAFDLIWIAQNRAKTAEGENGITDFYPDGAGDERRGEYFRYSTDLLRENTTQHNGKY